MFLGVSSFIVIIAVVLIVGAVAVFMFKRDK